MEETGHCCSTSGRVVIGRFHPFIGTKALRESRGIALLYF